MASLDLIALWEAHCRYEFETRDVDATMGNDGVGEKDGWVAEMAIGSDKQGFTSTLAERELDATAGLLNQGRGEEALERPHFLKERLTRATEFDRLLVSV